MFKTVSTLYRKFTLLEHLNMRNAKLFFRPKSAKKNLAKNQ